MVRCVSRRGKVGLGLLFGLMLVAPAFAQTKLLRFPDVHGDRLVFCHGGDLWTAPVSGGTAARLTAHPGLELFPKFSPDGQWIAFTGQYDGDEQVYVMPAVGGVPKQLTWYPARGPLAPRHGYDNQVYGWTPDGKSILFRSVRDANHGSTLTALYTVDSGGGLPVALPLPTAGAGDFSPDGKRLVYSPLFRDFRHWKRYAGGWAQDLWVFDFAAKSTKRIAPSPRTERDPMWIGERVYFVSDRDGTLNLYASDPAGETAEKLTTSTDWDVRWASSDNVGRIVYELGGTLRVYDVRERTDTVVPVTVPSDGLASRPSHISVEKDIESFGLSPKGERALFVARGDVFAAPIKFGVNRNLTRTSGAHDRHARWSPDGTKILYVSDATGEDQLTVVDASGDGKPLTLTTTFAAMLQAPEWAPDGKRIAVGDKDGRLFVVLAQGGKVTEVVQAQRGRITDHAWSPDGQFLAFSMSDANTLSSLHLWSVADGKLRRLTDETFEESTPAWDPEGQFLYFLSDREFAPQISSIEWNYAGNRTTGIFAMALRKDAKHPFPPRNDEVTPGESDEEGAQGAKAEGKEGHATDTKPDGKTDAKAKPPEPIRIDFEGLASRVARVPVEADNIGDLIAVKGYLLYGTMGAQFYGRDSYEKPKLRIFDMKERESTVLVDAADAFQVSADGSKVLVKEAKRYNLYDAKPKAKDPKTVATSGLAVDRIPAQEWRAIFDEVWRRYRDFFYVRNMHGYDWKALGERYRSLLPHVAHRSDLNYVLTEMVAELNVGHAYIEGGDFDVPERAKVGLPGARFALDSKAGRYRIDRIFRGQNEEEKYRSPLTEVGADAREGDYVLAIDGEDLGPDDNPYRLLRNKTEAVTLTLNGKPVLEGARKVVYRPIDSEANLLYLEWVRGNMERVAKLSGGRVGYVHIPDMGAPGIYEFLKWFQPQIRKGGLVVDARANGGGNVSQWILERLGRELLGTRFGYRGDEPATYPNTVFHGPLACLVSETSAQGGAGSAHRQEDVGRRRWHLGDRTPSRRGDGVRPDAGHERGRRQLHHRRARSDAGHRGGERSGVGSRRKGPTTRARCS
jgi:tricorn protease